jgi:hypothetical protein
MIDTLKRGAALWTLLATVPFILATPAFSQAPTDAQRSAIRSACGSDYQAHCAGVPPGGIESLQCLQKNLSSLSSSCQTAVRAVEPPEASKAESAPAEPAKPAAETSSPPVPSAVATTPAKKPSGSQVSAIRSACRSDYQKACAGVPAGGAAALNCLEKNKSKLSASCQQAVNAAGGGAATTATVDTGSGATAAAAPAPALMLRPMRPREELFVMRSACGGDVRALCAGIPVGGGRIIQCLATQAAALSPACKDVLAAFAAR